MDHRTFQLARVRALFEVQPEWRPVLWGELAGMPAVDLLNILAQGRKSGLLLVRSDTDAEHALALQDGNVHWAEPGDASATVDTLVRMKQGLFSFVRSPELQLPGDAVAIHQLLLDSLRRLDEETRDSGRLAG